MSHSAASVRTTLRVTALIVGHLAGIPAYAQSGAKDPRELRDPTEETAAEIEMRKRLDPLVPAIRAALEGDNPDAQRAALVLAGEFPPVMAVQVRLHETIATFLQQDAVAPELVAVGRKSYGRAFRHDPDLQRPGGPTAPPAQNLNRVVGRFIKSHAAEVRLAAAEALSTAVLNSAPARRTMVYSQYFVEVSGAALPLLADVFEGTDEPAQRAALEGLQNVAKVVAELFTRGPAILVEDRPKDPGAAFAPVQPLLRGLAVATPRLVGPLSGREPDTRIAAARTVESLAAARRAIVDSRPPGEPLAADPLADAWKALRPVLAERIHDANPQVRQAVVEAVEALGDAFDTRELLRRAASDRVVFVRWTAARAIGRAAPAKSTPEAVHEDVAVLATLTADSDPDVRTAALVALTRFGTAARSATPAVVKAATRGDVEPRVAAVKALAALATDAERTVPVLIAALRDPDLRLRRVAAAGLIRFGPDAKPALPELQKAATSPDPELRLNAAEAILSLERKPRWKEL